MSITNNPGYLVKTKTGKLGRTYHHKGIINGKLPVYLETERGHKDNAVLCDITTIKVIGFID